MENIIPDDNIVEWFYDYMDSGAIVTYPGFLRFLIKERKFKYREIKMMKAKFARNPELLEFLMTYSEGDLVENALIGNANHTMAQFVLKANYHYGDLSTSTTPSDEKAVDIKISIDPRATKDH